MKHINKYKTLKTANEYFTNEEYDKALRSYALVLRDHPASKFAYNSAILSEMAMSGENGASALFDYYTILREEDKEQADTIISEILESLDGSLESLSDVLKEPAEEKLAYEDGINYKEFRAVVEQEGDFKRVFENIMFSTRVIITEKEDFIDFLNKLVANGFDEMALNYLESAMNVYPNDEQLQGLLRKLMKEENIED